MRYAQERRQGRADGAPGPSPIIAHPDVKRMLLTMRALTRAARAICYATAAAIDRAHRAAGEAERAAAHERASLLTPVAKAFSTDIGIEVASLGVQVHGGMGYIEETGAAQHFRDARIAAIYEGTNGIQAIDLVTRKLPLAGGDTVKGCHRRAAPHGRGGERRQRSGVRLDRAAPRRGDRQPRARDLWLLGQLGSAPDAALAGAAPYLRLFGYAAGGAMLAGEALAASRLPGTDAAGRIATARFFAENFAVQATGLERAVTEGADGVNSGQVAL